MPPGVVAEILSDPGFPADQRRWLDGARLLEATEGFWERAGLSRAKLIALGCKPRFSDTLIAQACIDHDVPLLTRDSGFKLFEEHCGLRVYPVP